MCILGLLFNPGRPCPIVHESDALTIATRRAVPPTATLIETAA
jgi:hypothetical protein